MACALPCFLSRLRVGQRPRLACLSLRSEPRPPRAARSPRRACSPLALSQEDVYEKIDKELLEYVEDVLLNRRPDSTDRMLEFAAKLDPKSKPCHLAYKDGGVPAFRVRNCGRRSLAPDGSLSVLCCCFLNPVD